MEAWRAPDVALANSRHAKQGAQADRGRAGRRGRTLCHDESNKGRYWLHYIVWGGTMQIRALALAPDVLSTCAGAEATNVVVVDFFFSCQHVLH